jgi:hypothetical protein
LRPAAERILSEQIFPGIERRLSMGKSFAQKGYFPLLALRPLYPLSSRRDESHDRRLSVSVTLDEVPVLTGVSPCHPANPGHIYGGENPIGRSTCGERSSGQLIPIKRGPRQSSE